ncbi:hypothetical protein [Mucilaginibacter sp. BT774]|uniref:hypothetical protein n=1 Tax=Mucilaginibacter sp. BT774 TaxID=3062276 RepID=UPI002676CCD4|nr:hypothetical protein [Mucilaginibacter sp. BT774]MDO3627582.1 hypothetical protein [Mucilaginibacter sp. BT774]
MNKNQIMKLKGYDKDSTLCELQRDQPFSDLTDGKHFGMPISTCKFLQMLYLFWLQNKPTADNPFKDVWWVNFSKASIFRILAQEDCEYIRFYFAIPDKDFFQASLALEGIKSDGSPIKLTEILAVANTMTGKDDVDRESPGKDVFAVTSGAATPSNEEKGNGGPPLENQIPNISSLKMFADQLEKDLSQKTFKQFIAEYYLHAQKEF